MKTMRTIVGLWACVALVTAGAGCSEDADDQASLGPTVPGGVDPSTSESPPEDAETGDVEPDEGTTGDRPSGDSGDPEPVDPSTTGDDEGGPCCMPQGGPGCALDPETEACVCQADPYCCETEWDEICVETVGLAMCGHCPGTGNEPAPTNEGDCCIENPEAVGCGDMQIEACVCAEDPLCCELGWDAYCVQEVVQFGCGACEGVEPQQQGDCCEVTEFVAGCTNAGVEACVCAQDPFCCDSAWDGACVTGVAELGCGTCS